MGCQGMVVQWWPFSKKRTAYCENTTFHDPSIELVWQASARLPKNGGIRCGECNAPMVLRSSKKGKTLFERNHDLFYGCSRFPLCTGTHGCHADGKPLGIPGNQETKLARNRAHAAFDRLWKEGGLSRSAAYVWLAGQLGISKKDCHIGEFDQEQCDRVVAVCSEYLHEVEDAFEECLEYKS